MTNKTAVIAGGCFWGMEELFRMQPGVIGTEVGYTGGENENPTYENHPGHAEALKITYDDTKTDYKQLLDYFFRIHDPTTINRQGNDRGSSYRSAIFFENDEQREAAKEYIQLTNDAKLYDGPVVTQLEPLGVFYPAEEYHQDYLQKNPGGYTCHFERSTVPLAS
jgi:peptide-methionine (S)-S-oxide reductase